MPSKAGQQRNQIMRIHACFWSKMRCHDVVICVFCAFLLLNCCYKACNVPFSSLELIMVYCNLCKMLMSTALTCVGRHETDGFVIGHLGFRHHYLAVLKPRNYLHFNLFALLSAAMMIEFYILAPRLGRKPFYMVLQCNSDLIHIIWASNGSYKYQINNFRGKKSI